MILAFVTCYFLLPIVWLVIASTKNNTDLVSTPGFAFGERRQGRDTVALAWDRAQASAPLVVDGPDEYELSAVYYDTEDLRLTRSKITLRRRTGGDDAGWHLKVPARAGARTEVRLPLGRAARTVPEPLRRMVRVHSRGALLRPVAEISTDRTVRRLVDATGQVLAEVADERGVSPQQVALAWELAQSEVVIPIPGARRPRSITDSAAAAEIDLTDRELERLDAS